MLGVLGCIPHQDITQCCSDRRWGLLTSTSWLSTTEVKLSPCLLLGDPPVGVCPQQGRDTELCPPQVMGTPLDTPQRMASPQMSWHSMTGQKRGVGTAPSSSGDIPWGQGRCRGWDEGTAERPLCPVTLVPPGDGPRTWSSSLVEVPAKPNSQKGNLRELCCFSSLSPLLSQDCHQCSKETAGGAR